MIRAVIAILFAVAAPDTRESVMPITNADGLVNASGVLLNNYLVLTAAHAVGPENTTVFLNCGEEGTVGLVTKRAVTMDLALITLLQPCRGIAPLELGDRPPEDGEEVSVAGYPSRKLAHATGKVQGYRLFGHKSQRGVFWLAMVFSADVRPGNSGGPVISKFGKLVGIVHGFDTAAPGKPGIAVPLGAIAQFLAESGDHD